MEDTPQPGPRNRFERRISRIARRAIRRERRGGKTTGIVVMIVLFGCAWLAFLLWAITPA